MNKTTKLPSGKLIDLSRFVALYEDDNSSKNSYKLSLDGLTKTINIDVADAEFINQKLESNLDLHSPHANPHWDEEAQLRKNKPLMKIIKQWQEKKSGNPPSEEEKREYQDIQESLKRNRFTGQTS